MLVEGWVSYFFALSERKLMILGMSSLEAKDAIADYSGLDPAQRKVLDQWESFFEKVCLRSISGTDRAAIGAIGSLTF